MEIYVTNVAFWNVITFLVLVLILGKFAWGPIVNALDARMEKIKNDMDQAEKSNLESKRVMDEQKQILSNARREAQEVLNKAKTDAGVLKEEIMSKARSEAQEMIDNARGEADRAKTKAVEDVKKQVGELSLEIAGAVIGRSLGNQDHSDLIDNAIKQYQNSN